MRTYEIFDPRDGTPVKVVRGRWVARHICRHRLRWTGKFFDYEEPGKGW